MKNRLNRKQIYHKRRAKERAIARCFRRAAAEKVDVVAKCWRCGGQPVASFCPCKVKCPKCKKISWNLFNVSH